MAYIDYVNIRHGTKSAQRFSAGNTLPLTQMPFGMAAFAPQTASDRRNWYYHPEDRSLEGIRLTHQPSPWIGDYGHLVLMPMREQTCFTPGERWSGFRNSEAVLRPDFLKLNFIRYRAGLELTPTERGAAIQLHYDGDEIARLAILPVKGQSGYRLDAAGRCVTGFTTAHTGEVAENFTMYFSIHFDCDIEVEKSVMFVDGKPCAGLLYGEGEQAGIAVAFADKEVRAWLSTSFISPEQAERNYQNELAGRSFPELLDVAGKVWEQYLGRIEIETDDCALKRTFYSCMYRAFLFPRKFYEYDAQGKAIHYCADTGKVADGVKYVDNGFWDTFRTVYPMLSIIAPECYKEILQGFVNTYKDCGWLPKWPAPAEVGMMPGTLIDAVIAHAAVTGVADGTLLEDAFAGMLKHAETESGSQRYGRHGAEDFEIYGYIPRDRYAESVNHTLDYVYGDFCIAQTAGVLGREEECQKYMRRSERYRNIFDIATGFMRGRDTLGKMAEHFDPCAWGGEYCEGSAWQNSFGVYHDIEGLASLYGGNDRLIAKLDELFAAKPDYEVGGYGFEIHEMTELAALDFGQCAISNQPSFHLPYLFAALGDRGKTEYWVSRLVQEAFSDGYDGFPGDEDNGSTACWYIFAVLGLYPLCPGKPEYLRTKPLVKRAVLHTHGGEFIITQQRIAEMYTQHKDIVGK